MRLRHPEQGTVVELGDDLSGVYLTRGWVNADEPAEKKPATRRRKPAADETASE